MNHTTVWPILALASLAIISGCKASPTAPASTTKEDTPSEAPAGIVQVSPTLLESGRIALAPVEVAADDRTLLVPGEVVSAPEGEALVGSLVSGRVSKLEADVGDRVEKGKILAVIDAPEVGRIKAELARATAREALAKSRLERQGQLETEGATSRQAIDQARAELRSAEVESESARVLLTAWGVSTGGDLSSRLVLRSPISGFVSHREVMLGGAVRPEETLFHIVAPDKVLILARFAETQGKVPTVGTVLRVQPRSASPTPPCAATVETESGVVDPVTRTFTLRLRPEQSCLGLRPGAYVNVLGAGEPGTAPAEKGAMHSLVQVPSEAIVEVRGVPTAFVAEGAPGRFVVRTVLARPASGGITVVESGLNPGEKVAARGVILLKGEVLRDVLGGGVNP